MRLCHRLKNQVIAVILHPGRIGKNLCNHLAAHTRYYNVGDFGFIVIINAAKPVAQYKTDFIIKPIFIDRLFSLIERTLPNIAGKRTAADTVLYEVARQKSMVRADVRHYAAEGCIFCRSGKAAVQPDLLHSDSPQSYKQITII